MIDVRELRIGNRVLYNGEQGIISSIDLSDRFAPFVSFEGSGKFYHCKDIQPVPITEELLAELGFVEDNDLHFDYAKRFENKLSFFITLLDNGGLRIEVWDNHIHRGNMVCQYLHELENFVYMTTKKELI